jgi:flagellar protein FlaG
MDIDALALNDLPRPRAAAASRAAGAAPAAAKTEAPAISEAMMRRAIDRANQALAEKGRELTFEFNDDVGRVIVRLIDRKTGEVLRQIPSPEMVEIARLLGSEKAAGTLLLARA